MDKKLAEINKALGRKDLLIEILGYMSEKGKDKISFVEIEILDKELLKHND